MSKPEKTMNSKARWLGVVIALVVIAYGLFLLAQAYAPGQYTRFGYAPPLLGNTARGYGMIVVLLGCLPLLLLCRSPRQATVLGSVLGIALVVAIFWVAYA